MLTALSLSKGNCKSLFASAFIGVYPRFPLLLQTSITRPLELPPVLRPHAPQRVPASRRGEEAAKRSLTCSIHEVCIAEAEAAENRLADKTPFQLSLRPLRLGGVPSSRAGPDKTGGPPIDLLSCLGYAGIRNEDSWVRDRARGRVAERQTHRT